MLFQPESTLRHWLTKHGKDEMNDFSDIELQKLRKYFKELDEDSSGKVFKRSDKAKYR